jgi:hypothetical protein
MDLREMEWREDWWTEVSQPGISISLLMESVMELWAVKPY